MLYWSIFCTFRLGFLSFRPALHTCTYVYIYRVYNDMYVYILYSTYILIYCWYIMTHNDTEWRYNYVICMNGRWNEIIYLFMFIACANKGPPLSVVKISAITNFEATHAKQGNRYRVIPYHSYIYIYLYILYISVYTHFPLPKSDCLNESGEIWCQPVSSS